MSMTSDEDRGLTHTAYRHGFCKQARARASARFGSQRFIPTRWFYASFDLTTIESEAFSGIDAEAVEIPAAVTAIDGDPFEDSRVWCIFGTPGTAAETFANANGYTFVPITD